MARAAESTPVPSRDANAKSAEGVGKDLLADTHDGRLTMEVVGSMHEVSGVHGPCSGILALWPSPRLTPSARPRWRS